MTENTKVTTTTPTPKQPMSEKALTERVADKRVANDFRIKSLGQLFYEVRKDPERDPMRNLAASITPELMVDAYLTSIRQNPALLNCNIASFINSMKILATLSFVPGEPLGYAYLIPYKDECKVMIGYKGLIQMARRTGEVASVSLEVVYAGDLFERQLGDTPSIRHIPSDIPDRESKPITHVYAIFRMTNGEFVRSVWSTAEVDAHKKKHSQAWRYAESSGKKDSPWHTDWIPMAKKAVVRGLIQSGQVPISLQDMRMLRDDSDVIDVEPTRVSYSSQPKKVTSLSVLTSHLATEGKQDAGRGNGGNAHPEDGEYAGESEQAEQHTDAQNGNGGAQKTQPDDELFFMLDALSKELANAATEKACADMGTDYVSRYSRSDRDADAIVQCVMKRQNEIRESQKQSKKPKTAPAKSLLPQEQ